MSQIPTRRPVLTRRKTRSTARDIQIVSLANRQWDICANSNSNFGYLLHPAVAKILPARGGRVADVATGTGIWMLDIAREYDPSTIFDGYDISDSQFPPKERLPSNMTFSTCDCKKPFPPELHGLYDVVHVRMLIAVMHESDWAAVARNLLQLLRPGGALMWAEFHAQQFRSVLRSSASAKTEVLQSGVSAIIDQMYWVDNDNVAKIPDALASVGFERCQGDVVSSDRVEGGRRAMTMNQIEANVSIAAGLHRGGAPGDWSPETWQRKRAEMVEEMESGAYYRVNMHVAIGFKPV